MSTPNNAGPAVFAIREKAVYQGKIKSQTLTARKTDPKDPDCKTEILQLVIIIGLEGELLNDRKPEQGLLPVPSGLEAEVVLRFPEDNDEALGYSVNDLQGLGFVGEDLESLNPASKKFHSFVGNTCFVASKKTTYNDRERTYWNFRHPRKFEDRTVGKGEAARSPAAQAFRDMVRRRKTDAEKPVEVGAGKEIPF